MLEILEKILAILRESWLVLGEMAPFLLFGFLVAGILSVCASREWVERHLGKPGFGSVLKASLFGVPLPLCSCGVIPVSASMYRHGGSRAATTAFLLSTPQTGVDSIAITWGLLGPVFAIYRPIAALLTGLLGGGLVQLVDESRDPQAGEEPNVTTCRRECCQPTVSQNRLLRVLHYGFVTLPRDIGPALIVGILIAGVITALVPEGWLKEHIEVPILSILLMMAVGVPIYVCATASVPIALGFIHAGASPGAALAFLIAGPATNAATFTTIWKLLGRRTAVLYLLTVAASAIACGLLLDWLFLWLGAAKPQLDSLGHSHGDGGWLRHGWAIALLAVMMLSSKTLARPMKGTRFLRTEKDHTDAPRAERQLDLVVTGMTCSHCAESVRQALAECDGVDSVDVDLTRARAAVTGDRLDPSQLTAAVAELGYAATLPEEGT
ncbi:MAG: SO_0444 family Cu/Zn efflux transporter [Planctomycetota bacterium]|jgi:uncharacterized membrane protein YraQ (UPF0718 family)/copper chaperone CopZ